MCALPLWGCGGGEAPPVTFVAQVAWVDGRTPRLLFITVASGSAAAAGSIPYPGFKVVTAELLNSNSDPFDCDPATAIHTPPWGS